MYDPTIGRWLTQDPIDFEAGDANLYCYVRNSATNATDPTGLKEYALKSKDWDDLVKELPEVRALRKMPSKQQMGRYFERAVIRISGGTPYKGVPAFSSKERERARDGVGISYVVKPDMVRDLNFLPPPDPLAPPRRVTYKNSVFYDAKRVSGLLRRSTTEFEAVGYADALSNMRPLAMAGVHRAMIYITTTDCTLAPDLVKEFADKKVLLLEAHLYYDDVKKELYIGSTTNRTPRINPVGIDTPRPRMKLTWDLIKPFGGVADAADPSPNDGGS